MEPRTYQTSWFHAAWKRVGAGWNRVAALALSFSVLAASLACTRKEGGAPGARHLTFASGSAGGEWFIVSEGISEILRKSMPGLVVTDTPGGGAGNIKLLASGRADLAFSHTWMIKAALDGREPYDRPYRQVRSIAHFYPSTAQFMVVTKTGLDSLDDLVRKRYPLRLSVHQTGSSVEHVNRLLLGGYGVTYQDIESWGGKVFFLGAQESADMIRDGHLEAYSFVTILPAVTFKDLSVTRDIRPLSISETVVRRLQEEYGFLPTVIPAGTFKGQERDVPTLSTYTVLLVREDMPEELAYGMTKAIVDNLKYLALVHSALKEMDPHRMWKDNGAPLHPGAEKLYREIGVMPRTY
ncbi:MAG: TAXI family TRAP transporter solute-binding subunit [Acidobacteria bacterium]|nr:TAXI family TRAP transporter solute-binding subunit [Acidobacteriota bacterium]